MTIFCRFRVDVFEVCVEFDEDLTVIDLWCDCDAETDWCPHSTPAWVMLVHSLRVAEGHETSDDLPKHRQDVRLVQSDPVEFERVWRQRFEPTKTIAHSFLNPPRKNE